MNIKSPSGMEFTSVIYRKNNSPPPYNIAKVVNKETDEIIRQIPTQNGIDRHKSLEANKIDFYAWGVIMNRKQKIEKCNTYYQNPLFDLMTDEELDKFISSSTEDKELMLGQTSNDITRYNKE